jgi:hypothetical protein
VGSVTYYAQANVGSCASTRTAVSLTINANPGAPQICVAEPSLCGPSTGSISFLSPLGASYTYSINNGTSFQSNPSFTNLAAGSVTGIVMKDGNGCTSSAISCADSECSNGNQRTTEENSTPTSITAAPEAKQLSVLVAPNPFKDQVVFKVFAPQAGNGSLDIYNLAGQKIANVYSGNFTEGENLHNYSTTQLPNTHVIYRLTIDGVQVTGKLLQTR